MKRHNAVITFIFISAFVRLKSPLHGILENLFEARVSFYIINSQMYTEFQRRKYREKKLAGESP